MTRPGVTFLVNMGTTRPAITHTTITISPSSAYSADTAGTDTHCSTERWNTPFARAISSSSEINGMLRLLPACTSTRSKAIATAGSSSTSITANTG